MDCEEGTSARSLIDDYGPSNHSCGYCGNSSGFHSHGMDTSTLTVYDYQDLIDGGWRRSGSYLYKPDLQKMCCPTYTIRLNVGKFAPSKDQKKSVRRLEKYLSGEEKPSHGPCETPKQKKKMSTSDASCIALQGQLQRSFQDISRELKWSLDSWPPVCVQYITKKQASVAQKGTLYTSQWPLPLFAYLRKCLPELSRNVESPSVLANLIVAKFNTGNSVDYKAYALNGHINFFQNQVLEALEAARGTPGSSSGTSSTLAGAVASCQTTKFMKNEEGSHKILKNKQQSLEIKLMRSQVLEEEYTLYKKYQMSIHGDHESSCTKYGYHNFLVSSPMPYVTREQDPSAPECGYGAFHMQYRLDGKLVAVGVVDVLPRCLSSKYTFWDPDYAFLSLGKITALNEIKWVKEASENSPNLKYYCMGFYIQKCKKMSYKGEYAPSELLCPKTKRWFPLTKRVKMALDENNYCRLDSLSDAPSAPNDGYIEEDSNVDIGDQLIVLAEMEIRWREARSFISSASISKVESIIRRWRQKVGQKGRDIAYHL